MTTAKIHGVKMKGVAAAVPEKISNITDDAKIFGEIDVERIIDSTGVRRRHVTSVLCASDLCFAAAKRLLEEADCSHESVDTLIFVSQGPDYILPATSCLLQRRLKLPKACAAFDVNLGCSGYIYGCWLAANLIASGSAKRVLLLVGDTSTRAISPYDRATALLFGDAGTATLLEKDDSVSSMVFVLGTDGSGQDNLIIPAGGWRQPRTESTCVRTPRESGNIRSDEELFMNGAEIFTFTLREVPPMIESVLAKAGWKSDIVDAFVMHQANKFILRHLAKRMKLPNEKLVIALEKYGNTSSASIPLALIDPLANRLRYEELRLVLAGFGVGYSWGAIAVTCGPMIMPELAIVPETAIPSITKESANVKPNGS